MQQHIKSLPNGEKSHAWVYTPAAHNDHEVNKCLEALNV